jgi:signal transduction histidine kinase
MARDLHNTLAQGFTGVIMQMEAAEEALLEANSKQPD